MGGVEGAGLVEQTGGLGTVAVGERGPRRAQELEHVGLRLHPFLGLADQPLELGIGHHGGVLPLRDGHQLREPALVEQRLQLGAQRAAAGQAHRKVEAQAVEIGKGIVHRRDRRDRDLPAQVVHPHRAGGGADPLLEQIGGLELRIHPQHEVAAEERLLAVSLLGELQRLIESAEDSLPDVGCERGVTGVAHRQLGFSQLS